MIYVDNARTPYRRMKMCHMMADTEEELHAFAARLSLRRSWFHGDHYDICLSNRERAIEMGAQQVTSRYLVRLRRRKGGMS